MRVLSPTRSVGFLAIIVASVALATPAHAAAPEAPGSYAGLAFDACQAPDQATMDAWKSSSPFSAVGIYVSGNSRYCGDAYQPNLTPGWVQANADRGWRFLPIHVGYQSPCFVNNPNSRVQKKHMSSDVGTARSQGQSDANETIAALRRLGFGPGNVSYLDLEYYKRTAACDNVTLEFADAWTETLHASGYRSGIYSSGSAGIKALDDAIRAGRPGLDVPDHVWIAWTNGTANTDGGPYLSGSYFTNHQRVHQYKNGSSETFGGKRLTIDWNAVDVGGTSAPAAAPPPPAAPVPVAAVPSSSDRVASIAKGSTPTLRRGSHGSAVRRLQKALAATGRSVPASGYFGSMTASAVKSYRKKVGLGSSSTVSRSVWKALQRGKRG
ncbi:MAG: glycoside hydrolase domain-containing protein [Aeromicrobium sp.]